MDNKEAFAVVKKHLLCQNKQSKAPEGMGPTCRYYGPDGLKCAIGALIPEAEYQASWDSAGGTVGCIARHVPTLRNLDLEMLSALQRLHDKCAPKDWAAGLETLERLYG